LHIAAASHLALPIRHRGGRRCDTFIRTRVRGSQRFRKRLAHGDGFRALSRHFWHGIRLGWLPADFQII
jgi:hypothetical protein